MDLFRSLLFVPGNREDMLAKAGDLPANAVVSDMEDSVPDKEKHYARRVVAAFEEAEARGSGATSLDGKMIDVPVVKRARNLLALAESLERRRA